MRTRGEIIFVEVVTVIGTLAVCSALGWFCYWLLDNSGFLALLVFAVVFVPTCMAIGIYVDVRKGRYRLRELPGALFRPMPPGTD